MSKSPTCPAPSPKRQAILNGAIACFMEQGYAATTMDSVAAVANVSKATIYAHFSSKEDLFAAVIICRCEDEFIGGGLAPAEPADARTTLTQLARNLLSFMTQPNTLAIHRVVVAEAVRQPELANAFWQAGPGRVVPQMGQVFANLHQRGLLTIPDPAAAALSFAALLKSELFFCRLLGLPEETAHLSFDKTVENAVDLILRAYAA